MGKRTKIDIRFSGFAAIAEELDKFPGALLKATAEALHTSASLVDVKLHKEMMKHEHDYNPRAYGKFKTQSSIMDGARPDIHGNIVEQKVGFDIAHGGLASVFLMYGTPRHYQPNQRRMHPGVKADRKLYNAIYGTKTRAELNRIQRSIFEQVLRQYGGHWHGKYLD